jgi:alcohol dehydrogenase
MLIVKNFEFSIPTKVIFGEGKVEEVKNVVSDFGKKGLLIAARDSMRQTGILDRVIKLAEEGGAELIVSDEVDPNPCTTYIDKMVDIVKEKNCDFLIGLGGGSSMDAAKAIAFVAENGGKMEDYHPEGKRGDLEDVVNALPILAITTTAGTGSEVTMFSVITNPEKNEKPGIGHTSMYPMVSIVDPQLMVTVPKSVTASTGIDVLFHAMEAYISTVATPFTDLLAQESIRLVLENLREAMDNPKNIEVRAKMAWANTLAGVAIVQASTVGIHGMGHPIGGHTNAPHGLTMAALGKAFLKATYDSDIQRYAHVTRMLGYNCEGLTEEECAEKSSEALEAVLERFEVNISISDLGVTEDMIPQLAKDAFATMGGCMDVSLKKLTEEDAIEIYRNSLKPVKVCS